ncbi:hypothetical protein PF008_g17585 [Phytophthora fragariae]|uniref:ABC transporter domain-containing protein n=1 Tax=Phytophthora fragariae TaxID=53985 RepID=A0A6G0R7U6_9STRA|nr:hypothetical protein PF008_g17585 [Phytophthora fragariae]
MAKEDKRSLLQPEAPAATEEVPQVYRSLNFRSLQEPYSNRSGDTMASHYSTLRADNLDSMLNGGLERFYKKYNHLSRKINLQLPTPEVRFQDLSFSVQVPASVAGHNTVGSHLSSIFTPWQKVPMMTKHALHPMSGIIKPGSMTLILANPGAGKSTFLKAMAGKLQDNKQTDIGGEILYSGLRGEEIDLIKLVGLVDQMDNHIPTLTVRETFKFADMCVNGRPEDQPEEMRDIAALRTELFLQILGLESCAETVVGDALLRGSDIYKKTHEAISTGFNEHQFENAEDFKKAKSVANLARSKQNSEFGLAFIPSTMLLLNRQKLIWLRDPPLLWGKLLEALIIGLVMGMIYFNVSSKYYLRMIFFSIALFQRQAWQQITISFQLRKVFYKQRPRNFFRTTSYAIAESVVQIPVNVAVSFVLGTFFYFMSGLTRSFEKYIVFYLVLLCFQHAISAYMTMLSSLSPSITVGQALASISVSFFLLFSGNIILADLIPDYWIWMYWFSPISWALRSNMLSEFSSDRYTADEGKKFLDSFSIKQGTGYIWFGIGVLAFYYFLFTTLNGLALHFIRYEKYKGVSVKTMTDNTTSHEEVYVEVGTPSAPNGAVVKSGGLPFTPSNLCIKDLEYFVTLPSGEEKQLLRGITAHFEPGRMVALMGATGAGKTTLMDVMAGRKTGGRIVGDIIVNVEYKNSELYKSNRERTLELAEVSDDFVRHSTLNYKPIATGFWNQLGQLAKKQQLTYWRNPQYNFMRMFLFPLFAIIFGTTFYQLSATSVKKINSHIGLIYNSMDFIGVINLMTVLEVTCAERAVFYRERMSNYYGPLPYSLSLWFAEVPYLIVVIVLFVTIEYWLVGWNDNAGDFFFFMFVFYLYTSACTYVGQWMSALMPNEKVANVAVGALSCLFNLFSGYLLPRTAMKHGYKWFQYLMPSSYSLAALVGVQFGNNQDIIAVTANNVTKQMTVSDYIANTYDFRPAKKYDFMAGLIVIWIVLQVAIYLTFKYVSHLKR